MTLAKKEINFTSDKIGSLLFRVSLPPIATVITTAIINLCSGAVLSGANIDFLIAYNICISFGNFLSAFMFGVTNGAASLVSRNLFDKSKHNEILFNSFVLGLVLMLFYFLLAVLFSKGFILLYTDNPHIIGLSINFIFLYSIPLVIHNFSNIFSGVLYALGDVSVTALFSLLTTLSNLILNILFINGYFFFPRLDLYGIVAALIITSSAKLIFSILRLRYKGIRIFANPRLSKNYIHQLFFIAIPSAFQQFLATGLVAGYNLVIKSISENAIAVMSIFYNCVNVLQAFTLRDSLFSVIGSNLSQQKYNRVKKTIKLSILYTLIISAAFFLAFFLQPQLFLRLFSLPKDSMADGIYMFRILSLYVVPMMLFTVLSNLSIALGNSTIGFTALLVQTVCTLVGGFAFLQFSHTLSLFAFPLAAFMALLVVLIRIKKSRSATIGYLKWK